MYAYSQIEYEYELMNDLIEKEMHKVREKTLEKLSSVVAHPKILNDLALTLAYGYFDSYAPSEKITETLDLSKLDFLAIQEDLEAFKEEYLKDLELAQNF